MTKMGLEIEALRVESFPTSSAPPPAAGDKASGATSCPRPPYCTC